MSRPVDEPVQITLDFDRALAQRAGGPWLSMQTLGRLCDEIERRDSRVGARPRTGGEASHPFPGAE